MRLELTNGGRYEGRTYVSGHVPLNPDGTFSGPVGKVGAEVSEEEAYEAARLTALAVLASLKRVLGDLDRVGAWLRAGCKADGPCVIMRA